MGGRASGSAGFGPFRVSGRGSSGRSGSAGVRGTAGFGPLSTTFNGRGSTGGAGGRLGFNFGKREAEPHHGQWSIMSDLKLGCYGYGMIERRVLSRSMRRTSK